MEFVVSKFGGSSLACSEQFKKVINIINDDDSRKYIVVSAPGKYNKNNDKITDLLYDIYDKINNNIDYSDIFLKINNRYIEIVKNLNIDFDIENELKKLKNDIEQNKYLDFIASRGEYLNAKILASILNGKFIDAKDIIFFDDSSILDYEKTYKYIYENLIDVNEKIIIPGFYGSYKNKIKIFKRGGSDITGSLVAKAMEVKIYENWTDVDGVLFADPRIVKNAETIPYITYKELRELAYMGATVLQEDAIYPVSKTDIRINILNTNDKNKKGTIISKYKNENIKNDQIIGIAGKCGFVAITIEKSLMNNEVGFIVKLLSIFEKYKLQVEHCPTGIDTISVVVKYDDFKQYENNIIDEIKNKLNPDKINIEKNISLIAVVGDGIMKKDFIISKIFEKLGNKNIKIKLIDLGSSSINIIIGISDTDYKNGILALYELLNNHH